MPWWLLLALPVIGFLFGSIFSSQNPQLSGLMNMIFIMIIFMIMMTFISLLRAQ